jgi:hypothetical protein
MEVPSGSFVVQIWTLSMHQSVPVQSASTLQAPTARQTPPLQIPEEQAEPEVQAAPTFVEAHLLVTLQKPVRQMVEAVAEVQLPSPLA